MGRRRLSGRRGTCAETQQEAFIIPVVLVALSIMAALVVGLLTTVRAESKSVRMEFQVADNQVSEWSLLQQAAKIVGSSKLSDFSGAPDPTTASPADWRCNVDGDADTHSCLRFFLPWQPNDKIPIGSTYQYRVEIPVVMRWRGADGTEHTAFAWIFTQIPPDQSTVLTVTEVVSDHTWCYYDSSLTTCTQGG